MPQNDPFAAYQKPVGDDPFKAYQSPVPSFTPGTPGSGGAGRFAENLADALNPIPGAVQLAKNAANPQVGLNKALGETFIEPQIAELQKAGQAARGQGEFAGMGGFGRASEAIGHGLAGVLPLAGPAAAQAGEQIGEGDVAGGIGRGVGTALAGYSPEFMRPTGRVLSRTAEPIAEYATGVRGVDRKLSRNPGRAALDETTGFRPADISVQSGSVIGNLSSQRDALLRASPNMVDIGPSARSVGRDITKAQAGNSLAGDLSKVQEHLTVPHEGFAGATQYPPGAHTPIAVGAQMAGHPPVVIPTGSPAPLQISELQTPIDALGIRQRLGKDFTKFDAARPVTREQKAVGNKAYGELTNAIHQAVPESAPLDKRISNLIPVKEGADVRKLETSTPGKIMQRIAARTGGLAAGTAAGAHYGNPWAGAALGAMIPEVLTNPTAQMITARGLDLAGKTARSQVGARVPQVLPLVTKGKAEKQGQNQ